MAFGFSCSAFSSSTALLSTSFVTSPPRAVFCFPFPEHCVKLSPEVERLGALVFLCQEKPCLQSPRG